MTTRVLLFTTVLALPAVARRCSDVRRSLKNPKEGISP
jgi:hypothetical protein